MDKPILYQEKQRTYLIFYALIILVIAVEFLAIIIQLLAAKDIIASVPSLALAIILLLAFCFILINFFYLRIRITETEFTVSYGVFRLHIPRTEIKACEAADFSWKTYFGWGMRPGIDGTFAWTSRGHKGIRIETKGRNYVISTDNAEKICEIIMGPEIPRVRSG